MSIYNILGKLSGYAEAAAIGNTLGRDWLASGKVFATDFDGVVGNSVVPTKNVAAGTLLQGMMSDHLSLGGMPAGQALHLEAGDIKVRERVFLNPLFIDAAMAMRSVSGQGPIQYSAMPEFRLRHLAVAAAHHPLARGYFWAITGEDFHERSPGVIMDRVDHALAAKQVVVLQQTSTDICSMLRAFRKRLNDPIEPFSLFTAPNEAAILTFLDKLDPAENPFEFRPRDILERELEILLREQAPGSHSVRGKPQIVCPYDVIFEDNRINAQRAVSYPGKPVLAYLMDAAVKDGWAVAFSDTQAEQQARRIERGMTGIMRPLRHWQATTPGTKGLQTFPSRLDEGVLPLGPRTYPPIELEYEMGTALSGHLDPIRAVVDEIRLTRAALTARAEQQEIAHLQARSGLLEQLEDDGSFVIHSEETKPAIPVLVRENAEKALKPDKDKEPKPPASTAAFEVETRAARWMTVEAKAKTCPLIAAWADQSLVHLAGGGNHRDREKSFIKKLISGWGQAMKLFQAALQAFTGTATDTLKEGLWNPKNLIRHPLRSLQLLLGYLRHPITSWRNLSGYLLVALTQIRSLRPAVPRSWEFRAMGFAIEKTLGKLLVAAYDQLITSEHLDDEIQAKLLENRDVYVRRLQDFVRIAFRRLPLRVYIIATQLKGASDDFKAAWQELGEDLVSLLTKALGDLLRGKVRLEVRRTRDRRAIYHLLPSDLSNDDDLYRLGHLFLNELNLWCGGDHTPHGQLVRQALLAWDQGTAEALTSLAKLPKRFALYWGASSLSKTTKTFGMGELEVTPLHRDAKKLSEHLIQKNQEAADELMERVTSELVHRNPDLDVAREEWVDFFVVASAMTPDQFYSGLKEAAQKAYDAHLGD